MFLCVTRLLHCSNITSYSTVATLFCASIAESFTGSVTISFHENYTVIVHALHFLVRSCTALTQSEFGSIKLSFLSCNFITIFVISLFVLIDVGLLLLVILLLSLNEPGWKDCYY